MYTHHLSQAGLRTYVTARYTLRDTLHAKLTEIGKDKGAVGMRYTGWDAFKSREHHKQTAESQKSEKLEERLSRMRARIAPVGRLTCR